MREQNARFAPRSSRTDIWTELFDRAPRRHLEAAEALWFAGTRGEGCYLLDSGVLKICTQSPDGSERIIGLLSRGSIVGELNLVQEAPAAASVAAVRACDLRYVRKSQFNQYAERHPEAYETLARMLAQRLEDSEKAIAVLTFLRARGRVAHALLTIADSLGEALERDEVLIPKMMAQKELAAMAGVARENVNRILRDWEQQNLLTRSLHTYCIKDKRKLQREVGLK